MGTVLLALVLAPGMGRAGWDTVRAEQINPLNRELHHHIPVFLRTGDLAAIVGLYEPGVQATGLDWSPPRRVHDGAEEHHVRWHRRGAPEAVARRWERIAALFARIDRVDFRIHRVDWTTGDADGHPAEVRLLVKGTQFDGARAQLDQRSRLRVAFRDRTWRITAEEVTARDLVVRSMPRFEVATARAGIDDVHRNEGSPIYLSSSQPLNAGGVAVADVDRDGCEDLLLAGSPKTRLYRSRCDGTFTDVTSASGLPSPYPDPATGVVFFDYDNDGWPDLYVGAAATGDRLFHNVAGRFEDVTERAGIPRGRWTSMPIVADYDRDGLLDVYLVRMGDHAARPPRPNYRARNGVPNTLLRNRGDGTFEDVTAAAGAGSTGWDLAGAWGDLDDDGWPDLYLANEFGPNTLLRNRGDGTFEDVTEAAGADDPGAGMGVSWGDYDGDGDFDLYVSNMYSNSRWAIMHPAYPAPYPWWAHVLRLVFPEQVQARSLDIIEDFTRGSTLLSNDGDGTFTDVSDAAGIRDAQWGWAAEFVDYDNDGRLDIYATDGFYTGTLPDDV